MAVLARDSPMFGWFAPKCPVDTYTKTWVERRMMWLADRFGIDRLRNATVILPTDEFFPDRYTPDDDGCRACLHRMCGHMGVDLNSVHLEIADDELMPDVAGLYHMREQSVISVARSQLGDPMRLMATVAHELAHELLLKGGHLTGDEPDHEQVTDLLPVFLGVGIFAANATVRMESWTEGQLNYATYSKQGYLSSIELGYALAVFAFFRGENRPRWAKYLRTDAAVTLRDSLRYLRKTGDTLLHPDTYRPLRTLPSVMAVRMQLADSSAAVRLNALWDLSESPTAPAAVLLPEVEHCLADHDPIVRLNAMSALGRFGAAAARVIPQLIEAAYSGETEAVRAAAATTLAQISTDPNEVMPVLVAVLGDADTKVVCAAADALASFGGVAKATAPKLMTVLETSATVGGKQELKRVAHTVSALRAILPDASAEIRARFARADPEVRRNVLEELIRQEQSRSTVGR